MIGCEGRVVGEILGVINLIHYLFFKIAST
jgi:hypothetical protein